MEKIQPHAHSSAAVIGTVITAAATKAQLRPMARLEPDVARQRRRGGADGAHDAQLAGALDHAQPDRRGQPQRSDEHHHDRGGGENAEDDHQVIEDALLGVLGALELGDREPVAPASVPRPHAPPAAGTPGRGPRSRCARCAWSRSTGPSPPAPRRAARRSPASASARARSPPPRTPPCRAPGCAPDTVAHRERAGAPRRRLVHHPRRAEPRPRSCRGRCGGGAGAPGLDPEQGGGDAGDTARTHQPRAPAGPVLEPPLPGNAGERRTHALDRDRLGERRAPGRTDGARESSRTARRHASPTLSAAMNTAPPPAI